MLDDRRQIVESRFRTLMLKWLAELPAGGWVGTSHDLGDELYPFGTRHRLHAYVPVCPSRQVAQLAGFLAAHGFALTHRRTKRARTLRFVRGKRAGS